MCSTNAEKLTGDADQVDAECFYGVIKSYNERRGFGFVVCEETARRYGRDVYISKEEAIALSTEPAIGVAVAQPVVMEKGPPVKEGDYLMFQVQKSTEGFPQAVRARKFRRLRGVVSRGASSVAGRTVDGIIIVQGDENDRKESNTPGLGLDQLLGAEVRVRQVDCGQLMLHEGDEVTFCCTAVSTEHGGLVEDASGPALQAQLVELLHTQRMGGALLGCFSLELPRTAAPDGASSAGNANDTVVLDGHALSNRVVLAGVPRDLGVPELMLLFGKLGATEGVVTHPQGREDALGYASLTFGGPAEVARFLARSGHTISDQGATRIAYTRPRRSLSTTRATLPALPTPTLSFPDKTTLFVKWAQVSLAAGYHVELRPAGEKDAWRSVTAATGGLEDSGDLPKGLLGPTCSSCRVTDVASDKDYEARVVYYTSCGTFSEADIAFIGSSAAAETDKGAHAPAAAALAVTAVQPPSEAEPTATRSILAPAASASSPCVQDWSCQHLLPGMGAPPAPDWRCPHGNLRPAAAAPEMVPCSEDGRSICIRWPVVIHATAYTVELFEEGTQASERFTRAVPEAMTEALVELRVGNLQPGSYHACVRCVAPCGCESTPSPWSSMQPTWTPTVPTSVPCGFSSAGGLPGWKDYGMQPDLAHFAQSSPYHPMDLSTLGGPPPYMAMPPPMTSPPAAAPSLDALVLD